MGRGELVAFSSLLRGLLMYCFLSNPTSVLQPHPAEALSKEKVEKYA